MIPVIIWVCGCAFHLVWVLVDRILPCLLNGAVESYEAMELRPDVIGSVIRWMSRCGAPSIWSGLLASGAIKEVEVALKRSYEVLIDIERTLRAGRFR